MDSDIEEIGWSSGLRLALFYALMFAMASAGLFIVAYVGIARTIQQKELDAVRNRAAEYRAWFTRGDIEMLRSRMEEQRMEPGDSMFVRVVGERGDAVEVQSSDGQPVPAAEVRKIDPLIEGYDIEIGGERWAVTSLPLGSGGVVLQAGKNTRSGDATLRRLRNIFAITFIPAILTAVLGGALITHRAMDPIRRLIAAMRDILQSGNLGRRVDKEPGRNELNALVEMFNRLLARNEALIDGMHHSLDSVAHDFRTPLSRLNITAQRALQEKSDPGELREALADCLEESENLGRLLNTLMDVAEAEAGAMRLDLELISLPDLVERVVDLYEFVAEEREVAIATDLPDECKVNADRTRLSQALANLLDNAIKYSSCGSTVDITVREAGGRVSLTVRDRGVGIAEGDLPHVWDRLFRAERSRTTPGMGLGLSFVKAIIEAHGGSVSVTSASDEGSTFEIELPSP